MERPTEREGIVSFSGVSTPIGSLEFGGRLTKTAGTGFHQYRVYGMYALVLVLGHGAFRDKLGNARRVGPGDLIVVFPDVPHQYGPEAGDVWDEVFLSFSGPAFEGWRAHGLDAALPVWALPDKDGWAARFFRILGMPVTTMPQACAVASAIHLLIADALKERPPSAAMHPWLEPARQALSGGAGAPSLQQIAKDCGQGYETFRKTFRAATGESPARYRRRMRLAQAAIMMQRPDVSLEMIASALGFCDGFHLSKAFKLQYGHPPSRLRQQPHR